MPSGAAARRAATPRDAVAVRADDDAVALARRRGAGRRRARARRAGAGAGTSAPARLRPRATPRSSGTCPGAGAPLAGAARGGGLELERARRSAARAARRPARARASARRRPPISSSVRPGVEGDRLERAARVDHAGRCSTPRSWPRRGARSASTCHSARASPGRPIAAAQALQRGRRGGRPCPPSRRRTRPGRRRWRARRRPSVRKLRVGDDRRRPLERRVPARRGRAGRGPGRRAAGRAR